MFSLVTHSRTWQVFDSKLVNISQTKQVLRTDLRFGYSTDIENDLTNLDTPKYCD